MNAAVRTLHFRCKPLLLVSVGALLAGFSGCGTSADTQKDDVTQQQLLASDLSDLSSYKSMGAVQYDQQNNGIFTQIFGGTTGADLTSYLNIRVHYYIDKDEDVSVTPGDFANNGWTQELLPKSFSNSNQDVTVSAVNVSIEFWILGLINNVMVSFQFENQNVPLTSARTGIIVLDDGYSDTLQFKDSEGNQTQIAMPAFYRQSILIHEARHSDCTGGLSEQQLSKISQEKTAADFSTHDDAGHCGHLHVACPDGDYTGLYACDDETYGAYGVQDVFLNAALLQLESDSEDTSVADMTEIDTYSRLIGSSSTDSPDMSSVDSISP